MELLKPEHPAGDSFSGLSSPSSFLLGFDGSSRVVGTSQQPEITGEGTERVYVAVGKSLEKTVSLIQWTLKRFGKGEICLVHVHQPSPQIPTLLGKLPASQASPEVVYAHRREEKEQTRKLLLNYLSICCGQKVKASYIIIETDQVHRGIVDLVTRYGIRKLVMGAVPENCMKMKKGSKKANYAAKYAPSSCEIWFINKGRHLWTREASGNPSLFQLIHQPDNETTEMLRSRSLPHHKSQVIFEPEALHSRSCRTRIPTHPLQNESGLLFSGSASETNSSAERRVSSDSDSKLDEESLYSQLMAANLAVEASRNEAFEEILKSKEFELEAVEAINKIKALESGHTSEVNLRLEAEDALRTTLEEQEKLLEEREEVSRELQMTMRNVALLDSRAHEANRRRNEASEELRLIQASIAALRIEKQRIRRQKMEAVRWIERWRCRGQGAFGFIRYDEDLDDVAELSLSDLQSATCNFSESFKIGQGGYGCVYKGEMLDRTVAIKKLHPHNMQGQFEFQQEVQILGKLRHPRLVTLIGVCLEECSLVYEYLPNGSLKDRLFRKNNVPPLTWKIRVKIAAEISSALLFLHSCKPEKIIHGNLKPENILLDSELSCKICDFGICRLVPEETLYCSSFHMEPKGAFPFMDPEFHRSGVLTTKSDIYSFGLIILQLLTGQPAAGLVGNVRKAVSCGKLVSILDLSAGDWPMFVVRRLGDLGLQCCESNGRERPDLTPVLVRQLESLHVLEELCVPSFFLCPILQEIMHDPQVAADGFTYEGEALRGWLDNGRETSPMTNLPLDHLHLTPNHALRHAIQEWLCNP